MLSDLKKRYWPKKGMRNKLRFLTRVVTKRQSKKAIVTALKSLGVAPGQVLCVHCQMSALGYVPGGPNSIIEALFECVGGPYKGTIMMPAFPMSGLMRDYLDSRSVIDLRSEPTKTGSLTEAFRQMPGVMRSSHPTHSAVIKGPHSEYLIKDNHRSVTSFGPQTPWGKFPLLDESYLLLINTKILTILHVAQERINYPVLYDPDDIREVDYIDANGRNRTIRMRVMIPKLPYIIPFQKNTKDEEPEFLHLDEYPIVMPSSRMNLLKNTSYYHHNLKGWESKSEYLTRTGILKKCTIGDADIALIKASSFLAYIEKDMAEMIDCNRELFEENYLRRLIQLRESYQLPY